MAKEVSAAHQLRRMARLKTPFRTYEAMVEAKGVPKFFDTTSRGTLYRFKDGSSAYLKGEREHTTEPTPPALQPQTNTPWYLR